jgi:hypothetical protein
MSCAHTSVDSIWFRDSDDVQIEWQRHCHHCGVVVGMGPANDEPGCVQSEISAARIIASHKTGGPEIRLLSGCDRDELAISWPGNWLALEVCSPTLNTWPWDPSRPVAGQYEEWSEAVNQKVVGTMAYFPIDADPVYVDTMAKLITMEEALAKQAAEDEALHREAHAWNAPVREAGEALAALIATEFDAAMDSADAKEAALNEHGYGRAPGDGAGQVVGLTDLVPDLGGES